MHVDEDTRWHWTVGLLIQLQNKYYSWHCSSFLLLALAFSFTCVLLVWCLHFLLDAKYANGINYLWLLLLTDLLSSGLSWTFLCRTWFISLIHCSIIIVIITGIIVIVLVFMDALNVIVVFVMTEVMVVPYCLPSFNWSNVLKMMPYTVSINLTQMAACRSSSLQAAVRTSKIASFNSCNWNNSI